MPALSRGCTLPVYHRRDEAGMPNPAAARLQLTSAQFSRGHRALLDAAITGNGWALPVLGEPADRQAVRRGLMALIRLSAKDSVAEARGAWSFWRPRLDWAMDSARLRCPPLQRQLVWPPLPRCQPPPPGWKPPTH